jgi:CubicO group peptidase (beta-lactamase class C family)
VRVLKIVAAAVTTTAVVAPFAAWRQPSSKALPVAARRAMAVAGAPHAAVILINADRVSVVTHGGGPAPERRPYVLGSTTKSFTATAVMSLVADGRVSLDEPVVAYLPWFRTATGRSELITLRHLLNHTSGFATTAGWQLAAGGASPPSGGLQASFRALRLASVPGETFAYANANYVLLALVIEAVTGQTFDRFVTTKVLDPLEMRDTVVGCGAGTRRHRTLSVVAVPSRIPCLKFAAPAGYITTTPEDTAKYIRAHLDRDVRVLPPDLWDQLHTPTVAAPRAGFEPRQRYAMGWFVGSVEHHEVISHGGDVFDSSSFFLMDPADQFAIAVLSDTSSGLAGLGLTDQPAAANARDLYTTARSGRGTRAGSVRRWEWLVTVSMAAALMGAAMRLRRRTRRGRWSTAAVHAIAAIAIGTLPPVLAVAASPTTLRDVEEFWVLLWRFAPDVTIALSLAVIIEACHLPAQFWRTRSLERAHPHD